MSQLADTVGILRKKIFGINIPPELNARITDQLEEITRLEKDISARVHIEQMLRYIDWVVNLPWNIRSKDILDLELAKQILDRNHYGLAPVKDRILEYLAVLKLNFERWNSESGA